MVFPPKKICVGDNRSPTEFSPFHDLLPQDILKNLDYKEKKVTSEKDAAPSGRPSFENFPSLVNDLVRHYCQKSDGVGHPRNQVLEDTCQKRLKKTVYNNLLLYRKDYPSCSKTKIISKPIDVLSSMKANEVENIVWMTHVFVQQRRYDDANSLNRCLDSLRNEGHLEADSDVRQVLKFLVSMKGCGEKQENLPQLAGIKPRTIRPNLERPSILPIGPLNYGDTYEYAAQHQYHYMHFPSDIFRISSETQNISADVSLPISKTLLRLPSASPGTGITPLIFPRDDSIADGKVLGAMLQKRSGEISPDIVLSVPELPPDPDEYCGFNNLARAPPSSPTGVIGSDEGYDTRPSSCQIPEEDEEDVWERVLQEPPLTKRRTWENIGHPAVIKEKPFLSEAGPSASHNIWLVYQELWSHLQHNLHSQPLYVRERSQLCQDLLYLLSGVQSLSFPFCPKCQQFVIKEGLCTPGITPSHLRSALATVIECATYIRKGKVLLLTGEDHIIRLLTKIEGLVKRVKFVSSLCCILEKRDGDGDNGSEKLSCTHELSFTHEAQCLMMDATLTRHLLHKPPNGLSLGMRLIGDLKKHFVANSNREFLMLLIYILKSTCVPFFKYLQDWIYEGICYDPELEFMINIDSAALLYRDRRYWTHGYTLKDLSALPRFLHEVLEEAFACGKALNLLKICSPKHYLVSGVVKHPSLDLCITKEQLDKKHDECKAYAVHMDYLAAKKEVTAAQKEDKLREEKKLLLVTATKKHVDAIRQIEKKMEAARMEEAHRKRKMLKELKEEMEKVSELKKKQIEEEIAEDKRITLEREVIEQKQREQEEKLRTEIEAYYERVVKAAEQRETLARWKVNRCQLNEPRKEFITNYEWIKEDANQDMPDSISSEAITVEEKPSINVEIEVKPLFQKNKDTVMGDSYTCEGLLRIDQMMPEYVEPSPTEESTSGCDMMSVSRMSTSSDFIDTPHDENIPELEIDPERTQMEKYDSFAIKSRPFHWGNQHYKRRESFEPQLPESQKQWMHKKGYFPGSDPRGASEGIRMKVLQEEYGIDVDATLSSEDTNANFAASPSDQPTKTPNNANFAASPSDQPTDTPNNANFAASPSDQPTKTPNNANFAASPSDQPTKTPNNANFAASPSDQPTKTPNADDENGNQRNDGIHLSTVDVLNSNLKRLPSQAEINDTLTAPVNDVGKETNGNDDNDNFCQYEETRAKASLIKQKIMNEEFHMTTLQENMVNIGHSKSRPSSPETYANKQKILEAQYGIGNKKGTNIDTSSVPVSYSRQVSSTSTTSFWSCQSYDRQTSTSTVFSTPDEEKPVLIDQEPELSLCESVSEATVEDRIVSMLPISKVLPYEIEKFAMSGSEQILDICGSALLGKPSTVKNVKAVTQSDPLPDAKDLACFPINFLCSIKTHLAAQNRLVNSSLLSEVLVQESLLDHLSALRAFLLHDVHFARALILNLCTKIDLADAPANLLTPVVMNSILSKSISESCWTSNPFADNLSFAVLETPTRFKSQISVLDCLVLRYRVKWPHTLILDEAVLALYSKLWKFLASLHYSIWAADDLFCYTSSLNREDKASNFVRSQQFHEICLCRHQMHTFLLGIQAYVTSQVHQTSWTDFEQKIRKKVSSIDELYVLHSDLVKAIVKRCFLDEKGAVVLELIHELFNFMLQFRSQLRSHLWSKSKTSLKMEHPAFAALQKTYKNFKKHATLLHKLSLRVVERHQLEHYKNFVSRVDFNYYYSNLHLNVKPS